MTALLLALTSSASYGTSDFLASRVTKHLAPVLLVLYSQAAQAVVLLVMVRALRQPFAPIGLSWGAAAGRPHRHRVAQLLPGLGHGPNRGRGPAGCERRRGPGGG